jgi:hypothetical protein
MVLRIYWSGTADRNRVRSMVLVSVGMMDEEDLACLTRPGNSGSGCIVLNGSHVGANPNGLR